MYKKGLMLSLVLPPAALLLAYWGSSWGWDVDNRLRPLTPLYLSAAYGLLLLPHLLLLASSIRKFVESIAKRSRLRSLSTLLLGVYIVLASLALIHIFDSEALWLGSMGIFYIGFFTIIITIARSLA